VLNVWLIEGRSDGGKAASSLLHDCRVLSPETVVMSADAGSMKAVTAAVRLKIPRTSRVAHRHGRA
jgi:hypothetical protein